MYNPERFNKHVAFEILRAARLDLKNHIKNYCIAAEVTEEPEARHLYAKSREIIARMDDKIQNQLIPLLEKQVLEGHPDLHDPVSYKRDTSPRGREWVCVQGIPFYDYETIKVFNLASQLYRYGNEDRERLRGNEYCNAINAMEMAERALDKYLTTDPIQVYKTSSLFYFGQDELARRILDTTLNSEKSIFSVYNVENQGTPADPRYCCLGEFDVKSNGLEPHIAKFIAENFELPLEIYNGSYSIGETRFDSIKAHFKTEVVGASKTPTIFAFRFDLYNNEERGFQAFLYTNENFDYYKIANDIMKRAYPEYHKEAMQIRQLNAQRKASQQADR